MPEVDTAAHNPPGRWEMCMGQRGIWYRLQRGRCAVIGASYTGVSMTAKPGKSQESGL